MMFFFYVLKLFSPFCSSSMILQSQKSPKTLVSSSGDFATTTFSKTNEKKSSKGAPTATRNNSTIDVLTLTPSARKQKRNSVRPIRVISWKTVLSVPFFSCCFNVDASPAHVLLFCSPCWMYYSVILKTDKGEVGMLENAGDFLFPACQRGIEEEEHNPKKCLFRRTNGALLTDLTVSTLRYRGCLILSSIRCDQNDCIWLLVLSELHFFYVSVVFPGTPAFLHSFSHYQKVLLTKTQRKFLSLWFISIYDHSSKLDATR